MTRRSGLFTLWLAGAVAIPPSAASQVVRDHRIEVTKAPPRATLPRPTAVAARTASGSAATLDWMRFVEAPAELPTARPAAILASDITFAGTHYSLRGANRVVLIAETIRVTGEASFDLSGLGRAGAVGGSMVVLARRLACAPGARLTITSNGARNAARGGLGGTGGGLVLAIDEILEDAEPVNAQPAPVVARRRGAGFARPSAGATQAAAHTRPTGAVASPAPPVHTDSIACIRFSSAGGAGTGRTVTMRIPQGIRVITRTQVLPPKHGTAGVLVRHGDRARAAAADDELRRALSSWGVEVLRRIRGDILDAHAAEDYAALVRLFGRYARFSLPADPHATLRTAYEELRAELNRYRSDVLLPVYPRPVDVRVAGLSRRVHVFTESAPFRNTVAPTHLLSTGLEVAGRQVVGTIEFDAEQPDQLALEFQLDLTVDPWLAAATAAELRTGGDTLDGMFTGWQLAARAAEEVGVQDSRVTILRDGRTMRVRLMLDGAAAGNVLWKLFSGAGIPLDYDWEYRGGTGQALVAGTWSGPTLSLARRAGHALRIAEGRIHNAGAEPVTIEYVGLGPSRFHALPRALGLAPGESVESDALALPTGVNLDELWIPAEAVVASLDPLDFERAFHVLNGREFIERITLTNLLPSHDEAMGGALEYVELFVSFEAQHAIGQPNRAGPYRLSAAHTTGSEITLPFLRAPRGTARLTLWGAAHYPNGGCQTIGPTSLDSPAVKITPAMFRKNQAQPPATDGLPGVCPASAGRIK